LAVILQIPCNVAASGHDMQVMQSARSRKGRTSPLEDHMTSLSTNASSLAQYEAARRSATLTGTANPTSPTVQPPPTVTAATAQAADGAAQAQAAPREQFNPPMLDLPPSPSTREVMAGLTRAMADPTINSTTANELFGLHEKLMQAEKAMMQVIIDGMLM
jgi:hypothetical protein